MTQPIGHKDLEDMMELRWMMMCGTTGWRSCGTWQLMGGHLRGTGWWSAERPDWRRTLASEDEEPPTLDEMTAQGWRVVRSNLAPPNREIYRGPDPAPLPAGGPDQETPTWMGVSTQMPVRLRSNDPWEPRRGFSGTSRVREDSSESKGSFEIFEDHDVTSRKSGGVWV